PRVRIRRSVHEVGLAYQVCSRRDEVSLLRKTIDVLALQVRQESQVHLPSQLRSITTQILVQEDAVDRSPRYTPRLRLQVEPDVQERRSVLLVLYIHQQNGPVRSRGVISHGVVRVVASVRANVRQQRLHFPGIHRLVQQ